jgi:hypothetical protein
MRATSEDRADEGEANAGRTPRPRGRHDRRVFERIADAVDRLASRLGGACRERGLRPGGSTWLAL